MLIVQAFDRSWRWADMPKMTERAATEFDYRYISYELARSQDLRGAEPPCTFKPKIIKRAMDEHAGPNETVAWLDGDAVLVRELSELENTPGSVFVNLREPEMLGVYSPPTYWLNAGVCFLRNQAAAREFLDRWIRMTEEMGNDQWALSTLIGPGWSRETWLSMYGETVFVGRAMVHIMSAIEDGYNCWKFDPVPENARILHFKGAMRRNFDWRHITENFRTAVPA